MKTTKEEDVFFKRIVTVIAIGLFFALSIDIMIKRSANVKDSRAKECTEEFKEAIKNEFLACKKVGFGDRHCAKIASDATCEVGIENILEISDLSNTNS